MSALTAAWTSAIALAVFLMIDLLWLGVVARGIYAKYLGEIMLDSPRWGSALTFYTIFVGGLMYFVIAPAIEAGSLRDALVRGALFGIVTYATFDLTAHAVLRGFPGGIVPIDMAWGAFLAATVSGATFAIHRALT